MRLFRTLPSLLGLTICLALAGTMLVPALLGMQRYVITSGSMTGTYDTGSIVYDKLVATSSLKVGDVITYAPPAGKSPTALVTHRIASLRADTATGELVLRTKGDNNTAIDPWTFTLDEPKQAKVVGHVPYAGYAFAALGNRSIRMAVIGLPAALIALMVLGGMARDARNERRSLPTAGAA